MSLLLALQLLWASPELDAAPTDELVALDGLDALDRLIVGTASEGRATEEALARERRALAGLATEVERARLDLELRRQRARRGLVRRQRLGERARLALLARSEAPGAYLRQRYALGRILGAELAEVTALVPATAALERRRAAQAHAEAKVAAHAEALAAQRATLEGQRAARSAALRGLQAARRLSPAAVERARRLPPPPLPLEPSPFGDLALDQGRLPRPVPGPTLEAFGLEGDREQGRIFRKGLTLAAPRGAPVRAIFDGSVAYAGWYRGFGQLVLLDHGGGWFSLYAHLDRLAVPAGERLAQGDPVGEAGDTGRIGGPALYLELRRGLTPVDPAAWLRPSTEVGPAAR